MLAFVFVLGVLIFVHELGHYLMARRIGVRVLTFSLGFGPKLVSVRRGDTDYCISAIPLGGYVKMAGETVEDERTGATDEFLSKTKWQRFQVLVAGPVMNILLAIVVLAFVLYQGADVPAYEQQPPVVGKVTDGSPAAKSGIRRGDRIVSIADRERGHLGTGLHGHRAQGEPRDSDRGPARRRPAHAPGHADRRRPSTRWATSACCRRSTRRFTASRPAVRPTRPA